MKEKIKMEKLIELLNEYENTDNWENWHQVEFRESKIISKKFWFIKWLVDNDKIDMRKAKYHSDLICYEDYWEWDWACKDYEFVIMLLSIQDNPIEFLIRILK